MKALFVWVLLPLFFAGVGFSLYVVGTVVSSNEIAFRLSHELNTRGLRPESLRQITPVFESVEKSAPYRSAMKLLELGELVEKQDYEALQERLSNQRTVSQLRLDDGFVEQLKTAAANGDYSSLKRLISAQVNELVVPRPRLIERTIYQKASKYLPLPRLENP
jgi:hypothetical protein